MRYERRTSNKDGKDAVEITYTSEGEGPFSPRQIVAMLTGSGTYPSKWEILKWKGVVSLQPTQIRLTWNEGLPEPVDITSQFGDRPGVAWGESVGRKAKQGERHHDGP